MCVCARIYVCRPTTYTQVHTHTHTHTYIYIYIYVKLTVELDFCNDCYFKWLSFKKSFLIATLHLTIEQHYP